MTLTFSYWGRFECTKPTVCFFVTMRGWESGMTKQNSSARSISHWSPIHHFQGQWHISLQWDPPLLLYPWLFFESCPVSPYLHLILNSFSPCRSWSTSLLPYDSFHFKDVLTEIRLSSHDVPWIHYNDLTIQQKTMHPFWKILQCPLMLDVWSIPWNG